MSAHARMIDANVNRANEALRVIEDLARFLLDDGALTAEAKRVRHDLRTALAQLPDGWLIAHRDTPGDVGTSISTPQEQMRTGAHDMAVAAGKRAAEALRVIEEAAKLLPAGGDGALPLAPIIESLRYRVYTLDAAVQRRLATGRERQWSLCLLLSESLCRHPWQDVLRAALDHGVDCVQVREKTMEGAALLRRARDVIDLARPLGVAVIINDRIDIALAAGADGVHLGQHDLSVADARRLAGRTLLIGVSTHDTAELDAALDGGADYLGVGAMYSTTLKPERTPSGTAYLRAVIERAPTTPHLAIGGITPENVAEIVAAGARGIAVSSAICSAADVAAVTTALRSAVDAGASVDYSISRS